MAEKFNFSLLVVFYVALSLFSCTTSNDVKETPAPNPVTTPTASPATTPTKPTEPPAPNPVTTPTAPPTTTPTKPMETPAPTPGPCVEGTCGLGSTCEERINQTFICICVTGESYNYEKKICEKAKVFPGNLKLPELKYEDGMDDPKSVQFKTAADKITKELKETLTKKPTNIIVVKISQLAKNIFKAVVGVEADVAMYYDTDTEITDKDIITDIKNATDKNIFFKGSDFTAEKLCKEFYPCDPITTDCKEGNGTLTCECKEHFIKYTGKICVCPSGQNLEDHKCIKCDFGYSGMNCTENWKLILFIVGLVMGALLIIMLILVVISSSKKRSKKTSEKEDFGKPYVSHSAAQPPLFYSNGNASMAKIGVPEIPRATVQTSWNSRGNVEMSQRNTRPNVDRNVRYPYDDHRDRDPHGYQPRSYTTDQMRPQNNPFPPNRPQMNPYDNNRRGNPYDNNM